MEIAEIAKLTAEILGKGFQLLLIFFIALFVFTLLFSHSHNYYNCTEVETTLVIENVVMAALGIIVIALWIYSMFFWKSQIARGIQVFFSIFAILIILGNIIAYVPMPASNPCFEMQSSLKNVISRGYSVMSPQRLTLRTGEISDAQMIGNIRDIKTEELGIFCIGSVCAPEGGLEISGDKIIIRGEVKTDMVVCGDTGREESPKYCIAFSDKPTSATDECVLRCGME